MALLLVLFVVALATIIVINLSYSSYIGGRLNKGTERQLQAEYLLKSALSLSRILLQADTSSEDSIKDDMWAMLFANGAEIPNDLLGIQQPGPRVSLMIRPENAKLSLLMLRTGGSPPEREMFRRLFEILGFDQDGELDQTGLVPQREFSPPQLVANLVDYMDSDNDSLNDGDFQGIEGSLRELDRFPNAAITRLGELNGIPGFTPYRIQRLLPFVTADSQTRVNINFSPAEVLMALNANMNASMAQAIVQERVAKPFREGSNIGQQLTDITGDPNMSQELQPYVTDRGRIYQVIAKVDYQTSVHYMRAMLNRPGTGPALPEVMSVELF